MILQKIFKFSFLLLLIVPNLQECESDFDYETKPEMPYYIDNTEIDATIDTDNNRIKGVVHYKLRAKSPDQHKIKFNIAELAINSVAANNEEAEFRIDDDYLIISLKDTLALNEKVDISVTWQSESIFGMHKNHLGTLWSSQNPKALRHWLPVFDHPSAESKVTAAFTIPQDKDMVFNGKFVTDEIVSLQQKEIKWESVRSVPLTGLGFAVGNFDKKDGFSGSKKVQIYAESGVLNDEQLSALLSEASLTIRGTENKLSYEYPFETLNIMVMSDSYWEEKQTGAGLAYLYTDLGNLNTQLKRNIYGQWLGEYQRMENFIDNVTIMEYLKATLHSEMGGAIDTLKEPEDDLDLTSSSIWNGSLLEYQNSSDFFKSVVSASINELVKTRSGVIPSNLYPDFWYNKTGLDFEEFGLSQSAATTETKKDRPNYILEAEYDDINSELTLKFNAISGDYTILSDLIMVVHTFGEEFSREISFTGKTDAVKMEMPTDIEYITFDDSSTKLDQMEFGKFPILFLLNQLGDENNETRALAAEQLGYHLEDPDLQLALNDALSSEREPLVRAKLLHAYSLFTKGAVGTEQTFLKEVNNNNVDIQVAAINALGSFIGDEYIIGILNSKLLNTDNAAIFEAALNSYQNITDSEALISMVKNLFQREADGEKILHSVRFTMEIIPDAAHEFSDILKVLTEYNQPFAIRRNALQIWAEQLDNDSDLNALAAEYIEDRDPRIREFVVSNVIAQLAKEVQEDYMKQLKLTEYDPRVNTK